MNLDFIKYIISVALLGLFVWGVTTICEKPEVKTEITTEKGSAIELIEDFRKITDDKIDM